MTFHNPYHFVPVKPIKTDDQSGHVKREDFKDGLVVHATHDRYVDGTYSGRLICRLTTEDPIFVGAEQTRANPTAVAVAEHYELDNLPAIPATTLRGLISSIAEAASNSALRVLENETYKYRQSTFPYDKIKSGETHEFFKEISEELLPFDAGRELITLAEQLFGFVEQNTEGEALALAGRVRPSPARLMGIRNADDTGWEQDGLTSSQQDEVTLKILASPKPPSPAMYFKSAAGNGMYIQKATLKPALHHPQGRKFYLHRWPHRNPAPWVTGKSRQQLEDDAKQHIKIRPVKPRAVFYFHFDFDNLTRRELGMLLYALRPTKEFRHKIGMGKSIGLGKVRIEPVGLFRVDRKARYTSGLFDPRYAEVWTAAADENAWPWMSVAADTGEWPDRYERENNASGRALNPSPQGLHEEFRESMDDDIRYALALLGNPDSLRASVHTPTRRREDTEVETYRWFVENDDRHQTHRQFLKPILKPIRDGELLPTLEEN